MQSQLSNKTKKSVPPKFDYLAYIESQDHVQYIYDLLLVMLHRRKQDSAILCMNQLNDILIQIDLVLKIKQLHEVYLYSTYQKYQSKSDTKKRLTALMNQEKRKIDIKSVARWINENITKGNIKFSRNTRTQSMKKTDNPQNQNQTSSSAKNRTQLRLPPIRGTANEKLTEQLKFLVQLFEEMQKERQNSGLIPINLQSDDQQLDLSATNIPYDPQLYQLNKNLAKLRYKAEQRLARIIQLARDEPRIRRKLQQAIQKFQKVRIEANQKVGRIGAMKAQKRLIEAKKKQTQKIKNLKLGQEQDLLRAANLYSLLSIQEKKANKLII